MSEQLNVPDVVYHRIFQQDGDGAAILQELAMLFYDRRSYVAGDPHQTSFNEGQRSVVTYLLGRAAAKGGE